jgi:hypothetical protein
LRVIPVTTRVGFVVRDTGSSIASPSQSYFRGLDGNSNVTFDASGKSIPDDVGVWTPFSRQCAVNVFRSGKLA